MNRNTQSNRTGQALGPGQDRGRPPAWRAQSALSVAATTNPCLQVIPSYLEFATNPDWSEQFPIRLKAGPGAHQKNKHISEQTGWCCLKNTTFNRLLRQHKSEDKSARASKT